MLRLTLRASQMLQELLLNSRYGIIIHTIMVTAVTLSLSVGFFLFDGMEELLRIVHWGKAKKFMRRYPNAIAPLFHWRVVLKQTRANSFADLRDTFSSADQVGEYTVFNIGGNNFRLIAIVVFFKDTAYIRDILTHAEYDENKWRR